VPDHVVLVNKADEVLGVEDKVQAHLGDGLLHRAFTTIVLNPQGEILLQRRGAGKMLWPLAWEASCSSHPRLAESYVESGERRLREELGMDCRLEMAGKFTYQASFDGVGAEHEVCALLVGEYDGKVAADPQEIAEWRWVDLGTLREEVAASPDEYAPWLALALECMAEDGDR